MRVFAIADLHLSSSGAKPMDVFGDIWTDHASRMAERWDALVAQDDVVLVPGDLSWAKDLIEAEEDLRWIGARPGVKYLLRGNHDSWWASIGKVRAALPPKCFALQHDAFDLGSSVLVGARGWTSSDDPMAAPEDASVFDREIERLRMSLAYADRSFGKSRPRIAMLHFPPWIEGRAPTKVIELLGGGGVTHCVFGHLHGTDHALGVQGEKDGLHLYLVAADAIGFTPRLIPV